MSGARVVRGDLLPTDPTSIADTWWWDLVPAALGAILGAAAASIPAFYLARRASRETLKRDQQARDEARRQQQRISAERVRSKLTLLASRANRIANAIRGTIERIDATESIPLEIGQKLAPIANLPPDPREFEADELTVFLPDHVDMIDGLIDATEGQISLLRLLRRYEDEWVAFLKEFPPTHARASGLAGTYTEEGTPENVRMGIKMAAINALAEAIRSQADREAIRVNRLATEFGPTVRSILDDPDFPPIKVDANDGTSD